MMKINWHRLFGLMLMDYFSDRGFRVEQDKDAPTVLRPGGFIMGGIHRLVLAEADRGQTARVNPKPLQLRQRSLRPSFAEGAVVFRCAAFVAIAFDDQLLAVAFQRFRHCRNLRHLAGFDLRAVVIEVHRCELSTLLQVGWLDKRAFAGAGNCDAATNLGACNGGGRGCITRTTTGRAGRL